MRKILVMALIMTIGLLSCFPVFVPPPRAPHYGYGHRYYAPHPHFYHGGGGYHGGGHRR
ncbi:MAG: hypothetical protein JST82_00885 [Bacteroidetes bacterium]|nr:hypothetical protein [Bacteroidota bacterium]